jgi:hypothetical protein
VAGDSSVLDSGGTFTDRDRVFDLTEAVTLQACVPRSADGARYAKMRQQLVLSDKLETV